MEYIDGILQLFFSEDGTYKSGQPYPLVIFSIACGLMGVCIIVLDYFTVCIGKLSTLKLTYRGLNILRLIIIWGFASGIAGFLGGAIGILQLNRAACITVGVTWPFILPRILKSAKSDIEDVEDFDGEKNEVN